MKLFLDDLRDPPNDEWVLVKNAPECISLLNEGNVTHLSLDHDLGIEENGSGYQVACWIEEQVMTNGFNPPILTIHSGNVVGRTKMSKALDRIESFILSNKK